MNTTYIFLSLYGIGLVIITWLSSRKQSNEDYLNSSKTLSAKDSTWTTFASLLTGYNFVIGTTFAFLYGFWYLFAFLGAAGAFVVLYIFFKKKLSPIQREHDLFSLGDFFGMAFGASTRAIINTILCLGLVLFLILQIYINGQLFSALLGISSLSAIVVTVGVVCVYLWFGGFKASVKTDIFQGILILPIILTVFFVTPHMSGAHLVSALPLDQLWFAIGLAILQFLTLLAQAESFQRVFATKDAVSLKKSLVFSFCMLALVAGAIAYLGINFRFAETGIDPSSLFTQGVLPALPAWLSSFLAVSLIAAFMGTIDSSAFAFGILLANWRSSAHISLVKKTRYFTLGGIIVSGIGSLYLFSFLSAVFSLISLISIIGTALVMSLIFRMNKGEMNTFLITGTTIFVVGLVFSFVNDNPLSTLIPSGAGVMGMFLIRGWKKIFV